MNSSMLASNAHKINKVGAKRNEKAAKKREEKKRKRRREGTKMKTYNLFSLYDDFILLSTQRASHNPCCWSNTRSTFNRIATAIATHDRQTAKNHTPCAALVVMVFLCCRETVQSEYARVSSASQIAPLHRPVARIFPPSACAALLQLFPRPFLSLALHLPLVFISSVRNRMRMPNDGREREREAASRNTGGQQ